MVQIFLWLLKHCQMTLKISCTCLQCLQLWTSLPHSSLYWEVTFSVFFFMFNRHHSNWFIFIWLHKTFTGGTYFLIPFVGLVIAPCPTVNCTRVLFSDDHTASLALLIEKKTIWHKRKMTIALTGCSMLSVLMQKMSFTGEITNVFILRNSTDAWTAKIFQQRDSSVWMLRQRARKTH